MYRKSHRDEGCRRAYSCPRTRTIASAQSNVDSPVHPYPSFSHYTLARACPVFERSANNIFQFYEFCCKCIRDQFREVKNRRPSHQSILRLERRRRLVASNEMNLAMCSTVRTCKKSVVRPARASCDTNQRHPSVSISGWLARKIVTGRGVVRVDLASFC